MYNLYICDSVADAHCTQEYLPRLSAPGQLDFQDFGLGSRGSVGNCVSVCVCSPRNYHPSARLNSRRSFLEGHGRKSVFYMIGQLKSKTGSIECKEIQNSQDVSPAVYRWTKMRWHRGYCWRQGWTLSDGLTWCQDRNESTFGLGAAWCLPNTRPWDYGDIGD